MYKNQLYSIVFHTRMLFVAIILFFFVHFFVLLMLLYLHLWILIYWNFNSVFVDLVTLHMQAS